MSYTGIISNCYSAGDISSNAGGIIGYNRGIDASYSVTNSYSKQKLGNIISGLTNGSTPLDGNLDISSISNGSEPQLLNESVIVDGYTTISGEWIADTFGVREYPLLKTFKETPWNNTVYKIVDSAIATISYENYNLSSRVPINELDESTAENSVDINTLLSSYLDTEIITNPIAFRDFRRTLRSFRNKLTSPKTIIAGNKLVNLLTNKAENNTLTTRSVLSLFPNANETVTLSIDDKNALSSNGALYLGLDSGESTTIVLDSNSYLFTVLSNGIRYDGTDYTIGSTFEFGGLSVTVAALGSVVLETQSSQPTQTPPSNISLSNTHVYINDPSNTVVGSFTSTVDDGVTYTFTYSIVTDPSNHFTISGDQLITNKDFLSQDMGTYTLRVQSTNDAGSYEQDILLTIGEKISVKLLDNASDGWEQNTLTISLDDVILPDASGLTITEISSEKIINVFLDRQYEKITFTYVGVQNINENAYIVYNNYDASGDSILTVNYGELVNENNHVKTLYKDFLNYFFTFTPINDTEDNKLQQYINTATRIINSIVKGINNNSKNILELSGNVNVSFNPNLKTVAGRAFYTSTDTVQRGIELNQEMIGTQAFLNDKSIEYLEVILIHEIMHMFGYGINHSGWNSLTQQSSRPFYYNGEHGNAQYRRVLEANSFSQNDTSELVIPLEDDGTGSAKYHVEEGPRDINAANEIKILRKDDKYIILPTVPYDLMSSVIQNRTYFTSITAGVLQDLGYEIDYSSLQLANTGTILNVYPNWYSFVEGSQLSVYPVTINGTSQNCLTLNNEQIVDLTRAYGMGLGQHTISSVDSSNKFRISGVSSSKVDISGEYIDVVNGLTYYHGNVTINVKAPFDTTPVDIILADPTYNGNNIIVYTTESRSVDPNAGSNAIGDEQQEVVTNDTVIIPCFLKGTEILTTRGYKSVETLTTKDILLTHDKRETRIHEINVFEAKNVSNETKPYRIPKGASILGYKATKDLYLSPDHAILCNDRFIPVNQSNMKQIETIQSTKELIYYHLTTDNYFSDTVVANGIPTESYGGNIVKNIKNEFDLEFTKRMAQAVKNEDGSRKYVPNKEYIRHKMSLRKTLAKKANKRQ